MVDTTKESIETEAGAFENNVCRKAPASAEHARFRDEDGPCDDGRAGQRPTPEVAAPRK